MDSIVIGLGYKARSGKDEAAKAIAEERGGQYEVRRYGFSDALKREVNAAAEAAGGMEQLITQLREVGVELPNGAFLKAPDWLVYDPNADTTDPLSPLGKQRKLLQWWGTEYRREQDPFYWISRLQETIEQDKPTVALIADMRFPNEVAWVNSSKGYVVRVDRVGYQYPKSSHTSEELLDWMGEEDFHYILQVEDGDLEELRNGAVFIFDHIIQSLTPPDLSEIEHFKEVPGDLVNDAA